MPLSSGIDTPINSFDLQNRLASINISTGVFSGALGTIGGILTVELDPNYWLFYQWNGNNAAYTIDGGTFWTALTTNQTTLQDFAHRPGTFEAICVGSGSATNAAVSFATDLTTFNAQVTVGPNACNACTWFESGQVWIICDNGNNNVQTSPDGITWTLRNCNSASSTVDIIDAGNRAIMLKGTASPIIESSLDGITWAVATFPSGYTGEITGIGYNPVNGVAYAGDDGGNILASYDYGLTWQIIGKIATGTNVSNFAISANGLLMVCRATTPPNFLQIHYSLDAGFSWTSVPFSELSNVTPSRNAIGFLGGRLWFKSSGLRAGQMCMTPYLTS